MRYPLLPYSQLVYDSTRWMPQVYIFRRTVRIKGGKTKYNRWQKAIIAALTNHPVFNSRIDWLGRQYAIQQKDILRGKYHRFSLQIDGEDLLITGCLSRILGDGTSFAILMDDIRRAYYNEPLGKDDYWGYLEYMEKLKQSEHYADSKTWLETEFADKSIPVHPTIDRYLWTLFPPKVGILAEDFSTVHSQISQFSKTNILSLEGFFSLCVTLAIAEYNGTNAAVLTWAYMGREKSEEQRIFGSLHRDIPFCIRKSKSENHKSDLIRQVRNQIRSGIAHSDYPYTLTKPYTNRWNYAVNVLRVEDEYELIKLLPQPIEVLPAPPQKYAYALLDVEIHEKADSLQLVYRYSATHYKESSINKFATSVRKYAEWLLEE